MPSYCEYVRSENAHAVHRVYHDSEYGFPINDDNALFERLILEINQAGLSWETILKKQEGFRNAYAGFDIAKVAEFGEEDVARLLLDAGIIRNRLKIRAAISNAQKILELQGEYGSFLAWLEAHHPRPKAEWIQLFKQTFRFTGGEIVGEFLMSTGYLSGAHDADCPVLVQIEARSPAWMRGEA